MAERGRLRVPLMQQSRAPRCPTPGVPAEAASVERSRSLATPDAGKSTLTEALALHASAITRAARCTARPGRRGVTSDWMAMVRARGISITSAALRFDYRDIVLETCWIPRVTRISPEDTYRVLSAVDGAVMLLDSAKGLEPQTLKLFDVCRSRAIPGDHVREQVGPAGPGAAGTARRDRAADRAPPGPGELAGWSRRRFPRPDRTGHRRVSPTFTRTPGGAGRALETRLDAAAAAGRDGQAYAGGTRGTDPARRDLRAGYRHGHFLAGVSCPVPCSGPRCRTSASAACSTW